MILYKEYFQSWYYKITTERGVLVLIPGISTDRHGITHAFVQLLNGIDQHSYYFIYPPQEFSVKKEPFSISVGPNYFSESKLVLDLKTKRGNIAGNIVLSGCSFSKKRLNLDPFFFLPGLEWDGWVLCTHGNAEGYLLLENEEHVLERGKVYIESKKGRSLPRGWLWMQYSDPKQEVSLMFCAARVKWGGVDFSRFFSVIYTSGESYVFSSRSKAEMTQFCQIEDNITVELRDRRRMLTFTARPDEGLLLRVPDHNGMERFITQSICTKMEIDYRDKQALSIWKGAGILGGFENTGTIFK